MSHDQTAAAFADACATIAEVVRESSGVALGAPTPCQEYDVRALVTHFSGTSGAFAAAADGGLDADDPWGSQLGFTSDWPARLVDNLERAGDGWSRSETWTAEIANSPMPAAALGEMGLIEVVLHGWDLARASGSSVTLSDATSAEVLRCVAATADQGREFEVYGPAVSVPFDASDLEKALALAGRDPAWTA